MKKQYQPSSFIERNLGHLLVIPALILIAVFSLYPIIQSMTYSLFDYQVNNQQKNGMFFNNRFNIDAMDTKIKFISYYYQEEIVYSLQQETNHDRELIKQIEDFVVMMEQEYAALIQSFGRNKEDVIPVSDEDLETIEAFFLKVQSESDKLNEKLQEEQFTFFVESIEQIVDSFDETLITNNFVGLGNYKQAIRDKRLWNATKNTLIFTVISVFFELILGLLLALIMNKAMRGRGMVRTMSLIPWAIPTSVAALMWRYLYDGDAGFIAHLLHQIKLIDNSAIILTQAIPSMIGVIFSDVWKTTPYMALMILAGLQTIPHELYESSSIDGANRFQQFLKITLPLLKPSLLVALLFRTLDAFRVHDLIQVMTNGGPGTATESLSIYSYKVMRSQFNYGYGSTIVLFMAIMVGIISFIYIKVLGAKVRED